MQRTASRTIVLLWGVALAGGVTGGCAGAPSTLKPETLAQLRGLPELRVVHYPYWAGLRVETRAGLGTQQSTGTGSGLVGAGAAIMHGLAAGSAATTAQAEGAKLTTRYALSDPAASVKNALMARLATAASFTNLRSVTVAMSPADVYNAYHDELGRLLGILGPGVVLRVRAIVWQLAESETLGGHFGFAYFAMADLVRLGDEERIWSAYCSVRQDRSATAAPLAALEANGGTLLRTRFNEVVETCADHLSGVLLGTAARR